MNNLHIVNKKQLSDWQDERRRFGHTIWSIKGEAPEGAKYSDGDPIKQPINVAFRDDVTGEVFAIEYEVRDLQ